MDRRHFVKTSALAAIGIGVAPLEVSCKENGMTSKVPYTEGGSADIIIVGGGPAGIGAAVTAARLGKKVLLLEAGNCLGGIWTRSLLCCIMDFGRAEVAKEIIRRLDARGARIPRRARMLDSNFLFEPEVMRLVLEEMCDDAGVRYIYGCPVVGVEKDRTGRIVKAVFTESKAGRQRWTAKAFFDTTGDGDLASRAGCGYDFGGENPGDNDQPASFHSFVIIDDDTKVKDFCINYYDSNGKNIGKPKDRFRKYVHQVDTDPAAPVLTTLRKNLLGLSCGFEYGVKVDDPEGITKATVHARREMFNLVDTLLQIDPVRWKGLRIVATSDQLGQRASRRIHGLYTITNEDIINGATFDDAVAWSYSSIDVHATKKGESYNVSPDFRSKPFQIPFRACQAKDVDNIYMAGKCISGGFYPMSSYRMTGNAVEMGENVAVKVCEILDKQ